MSDQNNHFRVRTLPKRRQSLEEFDRLPHRVKEMIWYAPFRAAATAGTTEAALERALVKFAEDTARVYGPDHPGAAKFLATLPSAESLGF